MAGEPPHLPPRGAGSAAAADAGGGGAGPPLLLLGLDYRTAPIELRERVAYGPDEAEKMLVHLLARSEIAEALLLSTCNRTEVVLQPRDEEEAYRSALELVFLGRAAELERPGLLYVKRHDDAARHVLAVASGLESMVLGEPEILGQVKQAAALAEAVGAAGPVLRRLLRSALAAGRRARRETAIAGGAVSLGYAVVELARNIFSNLDDCRVLLLGAGEIARSVARSLGERGVRELRVANRSAERERQFLAEFPQATAVPFAERAAALAAADLVIASTGADEPVITRAHLTTAKIGRRGRPLLVVDLGVPRNVEPAAGKVENVFLHPIDSLEHLIQRNLKRRKEEVPQVEEIVDQELALFHAWYRSLQAEPLIALLQKQAERIRRQELSEALPHFPAGLHDHLDQLTRALVRKILHHPSSRLRGRDGTEHLPRLDLVRELFHLDDPLDDAAPDEPALSKTPPDIPALSKTTPDIPALSKVAPATPALSRVAPATPALSKAAPDATQGSAAAPTTKYVSLDARPDMRAAAGPVPTSAGAPASPGAATTGEKPGEPAASKAEPDAGGNRGPGGVQHPPRT